MLQRLTQYWVYGGALSGALLLLLTPSIADGWPSWRIAVWLMLPLYMFHQWEEHDRDRFRLFVNTEIAHGAEALTPFAVFLVNVPGVWGVVAASFVLCGAAAPGYGLIAVYLVLINAVAHISEGVVLRRYNPGLWSAVIGFIPLGTWALLTIQRQHPSAWYHLLGISIALAIHAGIVLWVLRRRKSGEVPA